MDTLISGFAEESRNNDSNAEPTNQSNKTDNSVITNVGNFTNKLSKFTLATFDDQGEWEIECLSALNKNKASKLNRKHFFYKRVLSSFAFMTKTKEKLSLWNDEKILLRNGTRTNRLMFSRTNVFRSLHRTNGILVISMNHENFEDEKRMESFNRDESA